MDAFFLPDNRQHSARMIDSHYTSGIVTGKKTRDEKTDKTSV